VNGEPENAGMSAAQPVELADVRTIERQARGPRLLINRNHLHTAMWFCVYECIFYIAYRFGMSFSGSWASPFWFPDSVLLAALLICPPGKWWAFLLGTLPIRLLVAVPPNTPLWFIVTCFFNDALKGMLVAGALRLSIPNPIRFDLVRDFALFCLFAVLLGPALSAFAGAASRQALGYDYWSTWEQWFLGDATAQLVVTPAILYGVLGEIAAEWRKALSRRKEACALLASLVLACFVAFGSRSAGSGSPEPAYYAPVPFLFWAAIRFGMLGASGSILILAVFSVAGALEGLGYFPAQLTNAGAADLQAFLLIRAAPLYIVAILAEQHGRMQSALRESERRFRTMSDSAPVLIWMAGPDKLCEFFNQGWLGFTGRTMEQERGNGWAEGVHPEDLEGCLVTYHQAFDARQSFKMEYRLRRHDGEYRWVLDHGLPRFTVNGAFAGYIGSAIDITERRKQETTLKHAQEEERKRIARELHDDFNQRLAAHTIALSNLRERIRQGGRVGFSLDERLEKLQSQAAVLGEEIRLIAHELHPPTVEHEGLEVSLRALCREFSALAELRVDFRFASESGAFPADVTLCCLRIVQEGLRNVVTHARASEAELKVIAVHNRVVLALADNGIGIQDKGTRPQSGLGISSMKERVELLSGDFRIANREPRGTIIIVTLPLTERSIARA
jgi:PAS domain S-box-containing protein